MTIALVLALSTLSGAGAAMLAGLAGPLTCSWPSLDSSILKRRLSVLGDDLPGGGRRLVGSAVLALIMAGGSAITYAAQPAQAPIGSPHSEDTLSSGRRGHRYGKRAGPDGGDH